MFNECRNFYVSDKRKEEVRNLLSLPPTSLQWEIDPGVDDYQRKQTKKGRAISGSCLYCPPIRC